MSIYLMFDYWMLDSSVKYASGSTRGPGNDNEYGSHGMTVEGGYFP